MSLRCLRAWPGMIFVLLGLNFLVVGGTIFAASYRKGTFAVEANYDVKALHWDDTAQQLATNKELGWTLTVISSARGRVVISLADSLARPLDGAEVSVTAFHHAAAANRLTTTLAAIENGEYSGVLDLSKPGLWQLQFIVKRGPVIFTSEQVYSKSQESST